MRNLLALFLLATSAILTSADWTAILGNGITDISAKGLELWCITIYNEIFRYQGDNWVNIPGNANKVGASPDGWTIVIVAGGRAVRYNGIFRHWEDMPTIALTQINVISKDSAIGVNSAGDIYQWHYSAWVKLPGEAVYAAIGYNGERWMVDLDSNVHRWENGAWEDKGAKAKIIDVLDMRNVITTSGSGSMARWDGQRFREITGNCARATIGTRFLYCTTSQNNPMKMDNDQLIYRGPPQKPPKGASDDADATEILIEMFGH